MSEDILIVCCKIFKKLHPKQTDLFQVTEKLCRVGQLHSMCMDINFLFLSELLPGVPRNITLSNVTAYTADLSWIKPADTGDGSLNEYQISLFRDERLVSKNTSKFAAWHFDTLRPYTQYTVVVRAGNRHDYGRETELAFRTNSASKTGLTTDLLNSS